MKFNLKLTFTKLPVTSALLMLMMHDWADMMFVVLFSKSLYCFMLIQPPGCHMQ